LPRAKRDAQHADVQLLAIPATIAAAAASMAVLASTAVAHAHAQDDQFIAMISNDGLHAPPDQALSIAHETSAGQFALIFDTENASTSADPVTRG
jgi:hypothetical protein